MSHTDQKNRRRAHPGPVPGEVTVPEQVIGSMAETAESAREGLLALTVSTGLQVMTAMSGEDVTGCAVRAASATPIAPGTGMAPRPGQSPWAGAVSL